MLATVGVVIVGEGILHLPQSAHAVAVIVHKHYVCFVHVGCVVHTAQNGLPEGPGPAVRCNMLVCAGHLGCTSVGGKTARTCPSHRM